MENKNELKDELLEALDLEDHEYIVDLPNPYNIDGAWTAIDNFPTREEAVEFIRNHFGGDDEGRISLISTSKIE